VARSPNPKLNHMRSPHPQKIQKKTCAIVVAASTKSLLNICVSISTPSSSSSPIKLFSTSSLAVEHESLRSSTINSFVGDGVISSLFAEF